MRYTADFETTTDKYDCRVWAFAVCSLKDYTVSYGNSIDDFMAWCAKQRKAQIYFHNLKFDGEFILNWLFRNGYEWSSEKKTNLCSGEFCTLISDKGQWYTISVKMGKHLVTFYDSLKILPFSVKETAKAFGLKMSKLSIDYKEYREVGHKLTEEEIAYIHNDVRIVAEALNVLFKQDLTRMTAGSNAIHDYKEIIGSKYFSKWFPPPAYDKEIRKAYRGGWTYLNPKFKGKVGEGIVLDVNSLYPSQMYSRPLPYGEGVYFEGEYEKDKSHPLYIKSIRCEFELKEGYLPTIQIKNSPWYQSNQYLEKSVGEVDLCLTNVDLELFFEHYDVYNYEFLGGFKFRAGQDMFKDYIDKWYKIKEEATISGNKPMRTLSKLMQNSLYGKFGTSPECSSKIPYFENGIVHYKKGEPEQREPVYLPMAAFITAWARYTTITAAQKVYDRFIYADTDSLHLIGTEIPKELEIHDTKLGAWAHESTFKRGIFVRQKCYLEREYNKNKGKKYSMKITGHCKKHNFTPVMPFKITCAGMPKGCYRYVRWDNFTEGKVAKFLVG